MHTAHFTNPTRKDDMPAATPLKKQGSAEHLEVAAFFSMSQKEQTLSKSNTKKLPSESRQDGDDFTLCDIKNRGSASMSSRSKGERGEGNTPQQNNARIRYGKTLTGDGLSLESKNQKQSPAEDQPDSRGELVLDNTE